MINISWIIGGDLDDEITIIREHYERVTGKSISKRELIKKLIYDNGSTLKIIETSGKKIDKNLKNMPKI